MNYYFLAASLPPVVLGQPLELSFHDLSILFKENLHPEDYEKTVVIRRYYDIQNIRFFWKKEELDRFGLLNEADLEEALLAQTDLPDYVFDFIELHDSLDKRLGHFPELVQTYFSTEREMASGFLKDYLLFEREWRLVLLGFRAKKWGRDMSEELSHEDPYDELIAQMIAQKDAKTYEPPHRYAELKPLFDAHGNEPMNLHQALCEYRFRRVLEMVPPNVFAVDTILGYFARLLIAERWLELDKQRGDDLLREIV